MTGASRGIGAVVAARLAADGFNVVINYSSDPTPAEALARRLELRGPAGAERQGRCADPLAVRYLFDAAESTFGGVDVLVNNAGVMAMKTIADTDDETFARQVDVNLRAPSTRCARRPAGCARAVGSSTSRRAHVGLRQPLLRRLRRHQGGRRGAHQRARQGAARPLDHRQRRRPGPTATELFFAGKSQEMIERFVAMSPLGRLGQPDDIAAVVSFLVGPDGGWVDGQTLRVNGGIV